MGTWGPGVFENDHALDLVGLEMERWRENFAFCIEDPNASWDDIEGVLVYMKLTVLVSSAGGGDVCLVDRKKPTDETSHQVAERWKRRFVELEAARPASSSRREEVERLFDALISLGHYDPPPQRKMSPLRKPVGKTPTRATSGSRKAPTPNARTAAKLAAKQPAAKKQLTPTRRSKSR